MAVCANVRGFDFLDIAKFQLSHGDSCQIQVGFFPCTIHDSGSEFFFKVVCHLHAHFIAAHADGWSDGGNTSFRKLRQCIRNDFVKEAAPSRVDCGNRSRKIQEHRYAIRRQYRKNVASVGCKRSIRLATRRKLQTGNRAIGMHLPGLDVRSTLKGKGVKKPFPVGDDFRVTWIFPESKVSKRGSCKPVHDRLIAQQVGNKEPILLVHSFMVRTYNCALDKSDEPDSFKAACAAASRAMGTRNGEQLT